jgi:transposase
MTKKITEAQKGRKRYSEEFKQQALLRAAKDGVAAASRDLGLQPAQVYAWRTKAQQQGHDAEVQQVLQAECVFRSCRYPIPVFLGT